MSIDLGSHQDRRVDDPPRRRGDLGRTLVRGTGQTLVTSGVICLLFVVYEVWVTDLFAARDQERLDQQIHEQWADAPTVGPAPGSTARFTPGVIDVGVGEPFAVLHLPHWPGATATRESSSRGRPRSNWPRAPATTAERRCPANGGTRRSQDTALAGDRRSSIWTVSGPEIPSSSRRGTPGPSTASSATRRRAT